MALNALLSSEGIVMAWGRIELGEAGDPRPLGTDILLCCGPGINCYLVLAPTS